MAWLLRLHDALTLRARARDLPAVREALARAGPRVLDLGGGTGAAAARVAPGALVVEPERRKVAHGRRAQPAMAFVQAQGEALPMRDASVDAVLAQLSLHHAHDPEQVLREAARVLRAGGVLVVVELEPSSAVGRLAQWWERRHGVALRSQDGWTDLLERAGFLEVRARPLRRGVLLEARLAPEN